MSKAQEINQNRMVAFLAIVGLLFFYKIAVWDPYFAPPAPPTENSESQKAAAPKKVPQAEMPRALQTAKAPVNSPETALPEQTQKPEPVTAVSLDKAGSVSAKTDFLHADISLLGGRLRSLELTNYRANIQRDSPYLDLVENGGKIPYPLGVISGKVDDASVLYRVRAATGSLKKKQGSTFTLEGERGGLELVGTLPDGRTIEKTFTFRQGGYLTEFFVKLSAPAPDASKLQVVFTKTVEDDSRLLNDNTSGFAWFDGSSSDRELYSGAMPQGEIVPQAIWAGFSDKYFAELLISDQTPSSVIIGGQAPNYYVQASGGDVSARFLLYTGPKRFNDLQKLGFELQQSIDLGWASVVAVPLMDLLEFFHKLFGNWGLAIIALTIVVKSALYPLTATSHKSMKAMQDLAPEMKRIQEQVKDRNEQQMQMMALYKKHNVNPLGGCLPMVLQLPVFIGLYYGLLSSIELRHAPFAFWIRDLSAPEELMLFGVPIPLMVILMVLTMLVVQWTTPTTANPAQKRMMLVIPIVFGFFFATFPAGLTLYFLVNNLISIGQTKGLQSTGKLHPLAITGIVSLAIMTLAMILVWLG